MVTLILDTSTDLCLIALARDGVLLSEVISTHENRLSKTLLPSIQTLVPNPSDLTGIALGVGPGSYTGTRLGASVAKTLGFALGIPLYPFLSPCAFIPSCEGSFAFLIETKPGPYFVLKGQLQGSSLHKEKSGLVSKEELTAHVASTKYLILPSSTPLPSFLPSKPTLRATPNLSLLARFLTSISPTLPEHVTLEYLHTPFFS